MSTACNSSASYTHMVEIERPDIDFMGHVNNATYLKWIQDAVLAHWYHTANTDAIAAHAWVALKHEITYRKPAFMGDHIVAVVTLKQVRRESAFYDTAVMRGDEVLAQATSRWCCLDAETMRPARLPEDVVERFLQPAE